MASLLKITALGLLMGTQLVTVGTTRALAEPEMSVVSGAIASQEKLQQYGNLMPQLLSSVAAWLANDFAMPANYRHPKVEFVSPMKIVTVRYRGLGAERLSRALGDASDERFLQQMRDVVALYEDASETIYLRESWEASKPADLSVLVHEMVHHLQNLSGSKFTCAEEREQAAYAAQKKWLEMSGRNFFEELETDPLSLKMRTMCGF
jgi:hypothetical protein